MNTLARLACAFSLLVQAGCQRSDSLAAPSPTSPPTRTTPMQSRLPIEMELPELNATAWLNSPPLTPSSLRGKVVLVEFWTYTCINWRRQLPYVRAWSEKYAALGLVVLGVHSPEFDFESSIANVRRATREIGIDFPVAIDNSHAIWEAFENQAWPALYFADASGRIRHHHFGEGDYARSEAILRELLVEAGTAQALPELATVAAAGAELDADWANLGSAENYLGYARTENFALAADARLGQSRTYTLPTELALNGWALGGEWTMRPEAVTLERAPGKIAYRFHARDVHLVMGPEMEQAPARFRVRIDGHAPGNAHGVDVSEQGEGVANEPRMYQLIRQTEPVVDRDFEIEFLDSRVRAFSFTFG